jgi:hypothetical protein
MPEHLQAKRVAHANEMVHRTRRQAHSAMHVDLLFGGRPPRGSEMQKMSRPSSLWKIARVFNKRVPLFRQLPVQQKRVSPVTLRPPACVGEYTDSIPAAVQFVVIARDHGSWMEGS